MTESKKRLTIKHPQPRIEKRYEVPIPERLQLKPKAIPANIKMKKVSWWKKFIRHVVKILEDTISLIVDNVFWLKWVFIALLFVMSFVVWLNKVQEYIDEQLSKPIQKIYEIAVGFGCAGQQDDNSWSFKLDGKSREDEKETKK